jgi:hypothetical protein
MAGARIITQTYQQPKSTNTTSIRANLMVAGDFSIPLKRTSINMAGFLINLPFMCFIVIFHISRRAIGFGFIDIMRCKKMGEGFGLLLKMINPRQDGLKMTRNILFGRGKIINDF